MEIPQYSTTIPRTTGNPRREKKRIFPDSHAFLVSKFYNSKAWKRLRDVLLRRNPIDQLELLERHVESATELHHLIKFADQANEAIAWQLFLDDDNIISVSKTTHNRIHYNSSELTEQQRVKLKEMKEKVVAKYLLAGVHIIETEDRNDNRSNQ